MGNEATPSASTGYRLYDEVNNEQAGWSPVRNYDGTSGVLCFGLKGGREFDNRFMDALRLVTIETHVADCHSCILHPASHTHRQLTDEQLREAGVDPSLIRLSIGLEDPRDIIADLQQALKAAQ